MPNFIYNVLSVVYLISSKKDPYSAYENMITYLMVFLFFILSVILIGFDYYEFMYEYLPTNKLGKQLIVLLTQALPFYFFLRFAISKEKLIETSYQMKKSKNLGFYKFLVVSLYIFSFLLVFFVAGSH